MQMRAYVSAAMLGALVALGAGPDRAVAASDPIDPTVVVWIVIDTLRADHLGSYGYARDTSPALDKLAAGALVFRRAIVQAPWTAPSIASALTSRYPGELGYVGSHPLALLDDRFTLLSEMQTAIAQAPSSPT